MLFQLRALYQAELAQLAAHFATGSQRRGMAGIVKGLRPEALGQIPDVGIGASCPTRQVHFADQESALQFHQRAFGRQLLRWVAERGTTPQFPRRLRGVIMQPVVDRPGFPGEPAIEIEAGHVPLVLHAAPGQS